MDAPFHEMLASLRAGDSTVVRRFVDEYAPFIQRVIRPRLRNAGLRSAADSIDLCQSIFGTFLIRISAGEYELNSQDDLERLLHTITKRKFAALARREFAECRDRRRQQPLESDQGVLDPQTSPGETIIAKDLLEEVCRRLPTEDRELYLQRRSGKDWNQIALEQGVAVDLLRKRLSRALNRVATDLKLGDLND